jgi:hypothetical protein
MTRYIKIENAAPPPKTARYSKLAARTTSPASFTMQREAA